MEIKKISGAQALMMARKAFHNDVLMINMVMIEWRSSGFIEKTAEEKFEEYIKGIEPHYVPPVIENIITLARAAIREAKEGK